MSDTSLRQIAMLSLIPGRPKKITARELHAKLQAQGHNVHVRSIERDLPKLSDTFPLISDDGRPAGWSWEAKEMRLIFPRMDEGTALTYELLSRYLTPVLPRSMRRLLEPEFERARRVLDQLPSSPLGRWTKRIAVLPFGHQLLPPEVKENVSEVVYEALLNGNRFDANYLALEAEKSSRYKFNPLGIVYVQGVLYLIATLWDYDDVRQFALHRMANAKLLVERVTSIKGFDFERYVSEEKSFEYPVGKTVRLDLVVAPWLARHLEERRLSEDQMIAPIRESDNVRIRATLVETQQLFWWLRSLGADVEILKPTALRKRMAAEALSLATKYNMNADRLP